MPEPYGQPTFSLYIDPDSTLAPSYDPLGHWTTVDIERMRRQQGRDNAPLRPAPGYDHNVQYGPQQIAAMRAAQRDNAPYEGQANTPDPKTQSHLMLLLQELLKQGWR